MGTLLHSKTGTARTVKLKTGPNFSSPITCLPSLIVLRIPSGKPGSGANVVMPETAVSAKHQALTAGEILIEHPGDNELRGIAFILGPSGSNLRQWLLRLGRGPL
jgi:hypothetical protein